MKKIVCWGGDGRMRMLAQLLQESGREAVYISGDRIPEMDGTEEVIFPVPTLDANQLCLTGSQGRITEEMLLSCLPQGARVTAYLGKARRDAWKQARPDLRLRLISEDEGFLNENGRISAEGALVLASSRGRCLFGKRCLVMGYGHMGRALCEMLMGLGAVISVAGRRGGSLQRAIDAGLDAWDFNAWRQVLPAVDWIFNTIPSPVLGGRELALLKGSCRLMELASAPYGIDRAKAEALGMELYMEASIPGRLYPLSAAEAMLSSWLRLRAMDGEGQDDA